ncbi:MAG TPA: YggS family pyridoxal phosphate-dependent enzyme [Planctomycetes bacterium]|nr:YggS family pyridoxal phosphate-dependent enzyme [Planctomycetota bacterium]
MRVTSPTRAYTLCLKSGFTGLRPAPPLPVHAPWLVPTLSPLPSPLLSSLQTNRQAVHLRIERAARAADRDPADIQLLPVTKAVDQATTRALYDLGERELAENRAQALEDKASALDDTEVRWHFIGHLQRNKARRVLKWAEVMHSVDSMALTAALVRICADENWQRQIYLQLNLTGEDAKHGMQATECREALALAVESDHLQVLGLMGMAPLHPTDGCSTDSVFRSLGVLAGQLESEGASRFATGHCGLSMGMSSDLEAAVSAGSTCLRIGSDLYAASEGGEL